MALNTPEIALIGGGTGSFTVLQELKEFTPNITAIVNMSDDGGSTGKLRDELGVLPPGDIRQCLVALSGLPDVRNLFNYRFGGESSIAGHSLGNLILSGLEQYYQGDFEKAIEVASSVLNVTGKVVPVTLQHHRLVLRDGEAVIKGEHLIGHRHITNRDATVELEPAVPINPNAKNAITAADLVVIAPGNLYGSLLPALATDGVRDAFEASAAKKIMVANLVNKPGQTDNWHVIDYVNKVEEYVGEGQINYVLYNKQPPAADLLLKYAQDNEFPLDTSAERFAEHQVKALGACLVSKVIHSQDANDSLIKRTLIRHDAYQVGRQLMRLFYGD